MVKRFIPALSKVNPVKSNQPWEKHILGRQLAKDLKLEDVKGGKPKKNNKGKHNSGDGGKKPKGGKAATGKPSKKAKIPRGQQIPSAAPEAAPSKREKRRKMAWASNGIWPVIGSFFWLNPCSI